MTRTVRPWLIGVLLAALLLGGCGIPDDTPVLNVGPGPSMGVSAGGDVAPAQHGREDTLDKQQFVRYYLAAAAGDPDGALKRAKAFLSPSAAAQFKSSSDIRVVHLVDDPLNNPGSDDVTVKYQVVGTLGHNGILDPRAADGTIEPFTMVVGTVNDQSGLFLEKVPPYLMITDTALSAFYDQHAIYFWNTEHTGLVPDVRYMPLTVPAEQRPTMILNWLVDGPAQWLSDGAVDPLPDGTAVIGNVPAMSNDNLQIKLNDQAVPTDDARALDRLRRQLQWSLRPLLPKTLELQIGHSDPSRYSDTDYLTSNFAYRLADTPERFVIFDGHVRRLAGSASSNEPIPVVTPADNTKVRTAALSKSDTDDFAALVVGEGNGKESLRVGSARPGQQTPLTKAALPSPVGHPSWAVTPADRRTDAVGLVPANGALYSFTPDGRVQHVDWAGGPTKITGVSIAPDGHRVAVLAGGMLYLTTLTSSGDGLQLSEPQAIRTLLLSEITAVDWSSEGWLAVAGVKPPSAGGRVTVMDLTIDGAQSSDRVTDLGDVRVTYLTAYAANPTTTSQHADSVSYVAGNDAYDALPTAVRITASELAEQVTNPPAGAVPTAPFFLN